MSTLEKPDGIPQEVWDAAFNAHQTILNTPIPSEAGAILRIAHAILAAIAEAEAERDMLQDILDARPAINAGLPETYIAWSQSIYSGEATRAYIQKHGVN